MTRKRKIEKTVKDDSGPQLIGYARVSTEDQSLEMQIDALEEAGCLNIWQEKISGSKAKRRPQLDMAIKDLREGDTLVVWRLDRLSRNMVDLYQRLEQIKEQGASFRSLTEKFDFDTATGQLILGVIALMAQFEAQVTAERTSKGIEAWKKRGKTFGAVVKFDEAAQRKATKLLKMKERRSVRGKMLWRKRYTRAEVCEILGISTQTLYLWQRNKKS